MNLPPYLHTERDGSYRLEVWVQPGARRSGLGGRYGDRLKVRLAAPPLEGRANRLLVRFFAELLRLSPAQVELAAGASGRSKSLRLRAPLDQILRGLAAEET